jgi:hypothetical protein
MGYLSVQQALASTNKHQISAAGKMLPPFLKFLPAKERHRPNKPRNAMAFCDGFMDYSASSEFP